MRISHQPEVKSSPMANVQSPTSLDTPEGYGRRRTVDAEHSPLDIGPGLTVTDLRKSFSSPSGDRIEVLRGASFSALLGETVAIMGSSGAGKSTLLHVLGGLEAADHGSIVAGEFSIDSADPSELSHFRNNRVGFVFQFHHLLPDLTAAENVGLPLMISRTSRREALRRAIRALEDVGLGDRISHPARHLSGGEQQRVAVCRALITLPALILADEPTGNLDTAIGNEIAHSLVSYGRQNGALVIIATHNRTLAELCDHVLILKDGRLSNL
jgi:lipoprotein-releasing system ATP-binding protein